MNKKIDLLEIISDELGLSFEEQDWGIINGSADRVEEFINYFNTHESLPTTVKYPFFDLIVASFNEDLLEGSATKKKELLFKQFIQQNSSNSLFKPILSYWKRITNEEDFPVGKFL